MMAKDLIEKLKDPKQAQPYGILSEDEQAVLNKAGMSMCRVYCGTWEPTGGMYFCENSAYILKPDYEPEPEYEDYEIRDTGGLLGIQNDCGERRIFHFDALPYDYIHLHCLPSLPNFVGFYVAPKTPGERPILMVNVATAIREGHTVVARFVKE
jgi:hypothetical protein